MNHLFTPYQLGDIELRNRIVMAPMCLYSTDDSGTLSDFQKNHYETRAIGGVGLILLEATAVERQGRITDQDLGIWSDTHVTDLKELVDRIHRKGAKIGVQLAHAGRKCTVLRQEQIVGPSAINFDSKDPDYGTPKEMDQEDIKRVINAFVEGAKRAQEAGFDMIEIHGAHGYLLHSFLSPVTNRRTDEYGGSIENRARLLREILIEVKQVWPKEKPIGIRVSAEDYDPNGNGPEAVADLLNEIKDLKPHLINVSSGGLLPKPVTAYPGYQTRFAEIIKAKTGLPVMTGGKITEGEMADEIIRNQRAELVFLGRELLRNPYWPLQTASKFKVEVPYWPKPYERAK